MNSKVCKCETVDRKDVRMARCIGAKPEHTVCGGVIVRRDNPQRNWERR